LSLIDNKSFNAKYKLIFISTDKNEYILTFKQEQFCSMQNEWQQ